MSPAASSRWLIAGFLVIFALVKQEAIRSAFNSVMMRFFHRAHLRIEIRQFGRDRTLASITETLDDYRFDVFLFFHLWVVNISDTLATVKHWSLRVSANGQDRDAEFVPDISKWHRVVRHVEVDHGFETQKEHR